MSFGAFLTRCVSVGTALGRAGLTLSDDAIRSMFDISENFGDDFVRAMAQGDDAFRAFIENNSDEIMNAVKASGGDGDDAIKQLTSLAGNARILQSVSRLQGSVDDLLSQMSSRGIDDLAEALDNPAIRRHIINTYGDNAYLGLKAAAQDGNSSLARLVARPAAAAPAATEVGVQAADEAASTAARVASLERWRTMQRALIAAGIAAPTALYLYAQADEHTGGAVTNQVVDTAVGVIKSTYDNLSEMSREDLSHAIHGLHEVASLVAVDGAGVALQTLAVREAMDSNPDNAVEAGQKAALAFQITRWDVLAATTGIRAAICRDIHPDMTQDERDLYLAEGLVDDLIEGANRSHSVLDTEFTREDVGRFLVENPEFARNIPSEAIRRGLGQMYPELADQVRRADQDREEFARRVSELEGGALTEAFHNAQEEIGWTANWQMMLATIFAGLDSFLENTLGFQTGLGSMFMKQALQSTVSQYDDPFGLLESNGPAPGIDVDAEVTPTPAPAR